MRRTNSSFSCKLFHPQSEKIGALALFPRIYKTVKNWGVKDFISSEGSQLVSGKNSEPEKPFGVSKGRNPPCFCGQFFDWRKM